jgi:hypothetical protein
MVDGIMDDVGALIPFFLNSDAGREILLLICFYFWLWKRYGRGVWLTESCEQFGMKISFSSGVEGSWA